MTPYLKGYAKVIKTAGLEKTALNERLLKKLLNSKFGKQEWDTRGILQSMRTGDAIPYGSSMGSAPSTKLRSVMSDEQDKFMRSLLSDWQNKFDPRYSLNPSPRTRNRLRTLDRDAWDQDNRLFTDAREVLLDKIGDKDMKILGHNWLFSRDDLLRNNGDNDLYRAAVEHISDFKARANKSLAATQRHHKAEAAAHRVFQGNQDAINTKATDMMTSGRHNANDISDIMDTVDKKTGRVLGGKGYNPDRVAYRATTTPSRQTISREDPRWLTAHPDVAGGYGKQRGGSHVTAYDLKQIPEGDQGPWSPHIAKDSRQMTREDIQSIMDTDGRYRGSSPQGESPTYEKVVAQKALAGAETHRYKLLPDASYMRVAGKASDDPLLR